VFLNHFDALISKIIFFFKKNIYYFDTFFSKKHFEKQLQPHFQTSMADDLASSKHFGH